MIELLKVSNGDNNYPGNFTEKENKIILENIEHPCIHLFSGNSRIGDFRVDFSNLNANYREDVFNFLMRPSLVRKYPNERGIGTVIIDPPYNQRFANKDQKIGNTPKQFIIFVNAKKTTLLFDQINRLDPKIIILKSWNYYCLKRYKVEKCYVCYSGGYRKPTFLIIMERKQHQL